MKKAILILTVLSLVILKACSESYKKIGSYDLVVYGATASGLISAYAAAKEGLSVAVVDPGAHIGGMVTGGLSHTDKGEKNVIGGYTREFFERVNKHYKGKGGWSFEPKVASKVFNSMLAEVKVDFYLNKPLEKALVKKKKIRALALQGGSKINAGMFIDASYEGDLVASAGITYRIGREPATEFYEQYAGFRGTVYEEQNHKHRFPLSLKARDDAGDLLELASPWTGQVLGEGDRGLSAYNYRVCMSNHPGNMKKISKPKSYNREQFQLLADYFEKRPELTLGELMVHNHIPNSKVELNSRGAISTDFLGMNKGYLEADYLRRKRYLKAHKDYTLSLLYFLTNDEAVSESVREKMNRWGLCRDEFVENDNFPPQLYVRVGRRIEGEYFMLEKDILRKIRKHDSVAMGSRPIELRHTQRIELPDGSVFNEGHLTVPVERSYQIPYRSITPKKSEVENLLVPVAVSASYVAYGSIRMEPVYMSLGHAAGVAGAIAYERGLAVQDVDYAELRERLLAQGQVIAYP